MPIILPVNGIVETYPVKPGTPRHAQIESVEAQGNNSQHSSSSDRSVRAAQSAYHRQSNQDQHPKAALLAGDLMTSPVQTLPSDSTISEAWAIMTHKNFSHIPLVSVHGTLVGMVSDRDLLRHVPELHAVPPPAQTAQRKLAEIMTTRVISATPAADIREVARIMLDERIHAVPILDGDRRPVGILCARDLLRGIANHGPLELWT
jgi:acetoin utilization protein AcuB